MGGRGGRGLATKKTMMVSGALESDLFEGEGEREDLSVSGVRF